MRRESLGDRTLSVSIHILLILLAIATFYPFWNAVVISFNTGADTSLGGITVWPRDFTLENYQVVLSDERLIRGFGVSVARTIAGTFLSIAVTGLLAYGLTKTELMGKNFYMILCIITMYFTGGLIPTFLLINSLGLVNTFWVLLVPQLVSVYNMIIFRTFFKEIPAGLEEAAKLDGCGNWSIFVRVIVPLSGPVVATLGLFMAIYHWNDWFNPSIYISKESLMPIQTLLQQTLNSNIMTEQMAQLDSAAQSAVSRQQGVTTKSLTLATMLVATLPIIMVYPFVQRYFVKGVMVGSLKG